MEISLISSVDKSSTERIRRKIIPLAISSLKETNYIDYALRESILSRLRGRGYYSSDEHVIMSISFDPKTCGMPIEYCICDCNDCRHNPLTGLLDPYLTESPFVITCMDTIDTLLDVISLLANANKNALLREKGAAEPDYAS